jgi:hypothetical protein
MAIYIDVMVRQFTDDVPDLLTLPLCGDVRGVVEAGSLLLARLRTDDNAIGSTTVLVCVHVPPNGMTFVRVYAQLLCVLPLGNTSCYLPKEVVDIL